MWAESPEFLADHGIGPLTLLSSLKAKLPAVFAHTVPVELLTL
jgi:hypothetical protein